MPIIVPPPVDTQLPNRGNHPSKPEMGEDEDYVEYLGRCMDHWSQNPPEAPDGFDLVECGATPRHYPEYHITDDDFYPGYCSSCQYDRLRETERELRCKAEHRRWKSWKVWQRISSRLYVLGITSSGGGTSYGRCEFCGIGRQHMAPRWRGKRAYILGVRREAWSCLFRRGHIHRTHYPTGLCAVCCPCPDCGSTDQEHYTCEATA